MTYLGFIIAGAVVIIAFVTSTNYQQLAIAVTSYVAFAFLALNAFPRKARRVSVTEVPQVTQMPVKPMETVQVATPTAPEKEETGIPDIDKRAFLKLIGGAGLTIFLFSLFNKRGEGLLFKNVPAAGPLTLQDSNGKVVDPAERQPMDGYKISEVDDNIITFYGFTNKVGAWIIMREDTETGSFRYLKGASDFPHSWAKHEKLAYDYFHNVFND